MKTYTVYNQQKMNWTYIIGLLLVLTFSSCFKPEVDPQVAKFQYGNPYDVDMGSEQLLSLDAKILAGHYGPIKSFIVARNNQIVFENYYNNTDPKELQPLNDATAGIVALLIGILDYQHDQNLFRSKVINELNDLPQYFDDIPLKNEIEIRHLLYNNSGLRWGEWGLYGSQTNNYDEMIKTDDWLDYVLSRPMAYEPGLKFEYNSGHQIILREIIEKRSQKSFLTFADDHLFKPIYISNYQWDSGTDNRTNTINGLSVRPIDMVALGQLIVDNGVANDTLMPSYWTSLMKGQTSIGSYLLGMNWYTLYVGHPLSAKYPNESRMMFLWGDGGQFIFVMPKAKIVIVSTADHEEATNEVNSFMQMILDGLSIGFVAP